MGTIQTARGELETAQIGATLMHEHIFILSPEIMNNYPDEWGDDEGRINDAVARLDELKQNGIDAIVDLTVLGLGRDVSRIKKVAERTDLQIIVGAGLYTYNQLTLNRPERLNAWTPQMMKELTRAVEAANADDTVGAIVVTGAGRGFCAGADIGQQFAPALDGPGATGPTELPPATGCACAASPSPSWRRSTGPPWEWA